DDVFGRAGLDGRLVEDGGGLASAFLRARVRAEHHGVAGFERDQGLVDGGGSRVGSGENGGHYADRDADFDQALLGNLAQNADRLHAAHAAREPVATEKILDVLVGGVAVAGFFDREIGQAPGISAGRGGHAFDDCVDLVL